MGVNVAGHMEADALTQGIESGARYEFRVKRANQSERKTGKRKRKRNPLKLTIHSPAGVSAACLLHFLFSIQTL